MEVMIYDKADEVIFESLLSRYQIWLETSMRCKDFIFDGVSYFKCNAISFKHGISYIGSPGG